MDFFRTFFPSSPVVLKLLCSSFSELPIKQPQSIIIWVKTTFCKSKGIESLVYKLNTCRLVAKFASIYGYKMTFTFSFVSPSTGRIRHIDIIVKPKSPHSIRTSVNDQESSQLIPFDPEDLSFYHVSFIVA